MLKLCPAEVVILDFQSTTKKTHFEKHHQMNIIAEFDVKWLRGFQIRIIFKNFPIGPMLNLFCGGHLGFQIKT
jgi:hypothetical protein